jgi:CheY-like chemotaxis protein
LKTLDAFVSNLKDNDDKEDNDDLVEDGVNDNLEKPIKTEEECGAALNKLSHK